MMRRNKFSANGGEGISGDLVMPGDKSISHRAVMCGSLAKGITRISNCLMSDDVMATIKAFELMGVGFEFDSPSSVLIKGTDRLLDPPKGVLNLGNSGTSIRLLTGILAGLNVRATLNGDDSLQGRPMQRIAVPLVMMGAAINLRGEKFPPIEIFNSKGLRGIDYTLPIASAQVKSSIIFAGLFAEGTSTVRESVATRDHTERMLYRFGVKLLVNDGQISVRGGDELKAVELEIPGDLSSAAFFIVGAVISKHGGVRVNGVGTNPTRDGVIAILREMGAKIEIENERIIGNEPVADILAFPSSLKGIPIDQGLIASAIDEFPIIFIAAACASGKTRLRGAVELRHKESDRLDVMATNLSKLGIGVQLFEDGLEITGGDIKTGEIDAKGDHRIAMAFAVASLRSGGPIIIENAAEISTSFPNFFEIAKEAGLRLIC